MQVFCVSCFRPGTQTAHMASQGNATTRSSFAHESHFFTANTAQQQQMLKMSLGPGVHVGKFDVPHFNLSAPMGTSVFQLQKEREFAQKNFKALSKKYCDSLAALEEQEGPNAKRPQFIEEPKPGPAHVVCAICREQFTDYYQHIYSARHKRGVAANNSIFEQIDQAIVDIERGQVLKREEELAHLLKMSSTRKADAELKRNPFGAV